MMNRKKDGKENDEIKKDVKEKRWKLKTID